MSQSLFYWNNPCNEDVVDDAIKDYVSQSLFYWNNPCNKLVVGEKMNKEKVTILVLLE